jgi:hypothetical protein
MNCRRKSGMEMGKQNVVVQKLVFLFFFFSFSFSPPGVQPCGWADTVKKRGRRPEAEQHERKEWRHRYKAGVDNRRLFLFHTRTTHPHTPQRER